MEIPEIDPTKLDFKVDYRFLSREITLTLRANDDEVYKLLVKEVEEMEEAMIEDLKRLKAETP